MPCIIACNVFSKSSLRDLGTVITSLREKQSRENTIGSKNIVYEKIQGVERGTYILANNEHYKKDECLHGSRLNCGH